MMKSVKKAIIAALCAGTLVVGSVAGTMAYLTAQDSVTNTFTVGNVAITLDEQNVDGKDAKGNANVDLERDQANSYQLFPGKSYTKDPTVHVNEKSEDCWLFVKVENGIADLEATEEMGETGYKKIATQITNNQWTALNGVANVYYKEVAKTAPNRDYEVFGNFKIAGDGVVGGEKPEDYTGTDKYLGEYENAEIVVTAYAVQKDGFNNAADAWTATFGKASTNSEETN